MVIAMTIYLAENDARIIALLAGRCVTVAGSAVAVSYANDSLSNPVMYIQLRQKLVKPEEK